MANPLRMECSMHIHLIVSFILIRSLLDSYIFIKTLLLCNIFLSLTLVFKTYSPLRK